VREREDASRTREAGNRDEVEGVVANMLNLLCNGAVGFIDWLDDSASSRCRCGNYIQSRKILNVNVERLALLRYNTLQIGLIGNGKILRSPHYYRIASVEDGNFFETSIGGDGLLQACSNVGVQACTLILPPCTANKNEHDENNGEQREENAPRAAHSHLTRSRPENPAFNYGIFRPIAADFRWICFHTGGCPERRDGLGSS
jgi:hypothetical protein